MNDSVTGPLVLVVEHDAECPPALFGTWLTEAGARLEICRPWAGEELPTLASYDALVVLGGPMGAGDAARYPWLSTVKQRFLEAAETETPALGICLGHQLAAVAFGGTVVPNGRGQQVGLLDVVWTTQAAQDPLLSSVSTPRRGVQWNNDVVSALDGRATVLAATARGEIQAVRFAPTVWGVQLHPEVDRPVVEAWAVSDRGSHEMLGINQEAVLSEIDAARDELDEAWRPLAVALVALATDAVSRRS